ncbi:FKBP-type peptidyl-prolyl cis-trans isomerase N-terminal domain-containing protein [Escherichia coli]|nr:FKBP-type peptidyl-prolyl cis-trans isomerase N-terminal domain-containing protein [Escherichia coli]MDY9212516.1 FKBP-type peptidyl-prolyl cis-trans isomerase N-terminal domain-containing protein [Escherichia coli]MDY9267088.1 FKBP-type peptidyl-prolyl cis-trans isomerase N-terminal domain-containing protein [Escherichia coli]MDY9321871.1 FKBP-type peptidyl-prolyl cis-trans isomerase N-terminal domain-containing protein [Escherichia coli]MDY9326741.1 FKBP-type peptidyl-prolyl cis-trans isom
MKPKYITCLLALNIFCFFSESAWSVDRGVQNDKTKTLNSTKSDKIYVDNSDIYSVESSFSSQSLSDSQKNQYNILQRKKIFERVISDVRKVRENLNELEKIHEKEMKSLTERNELIFNKLTKDIISLRQKLSDRESEQKNLSEEGKDKNLASAIEEIKLKDQKIHELSELNKKLNEKVALVPVINSNELNTSTNQQDYATGIMTGRDILVLIAANKMLGVNTDKRILLAGIQDALNNKELLNEDKLQSVLDDAERNLQKSRMETARKWKKMGEIWINKFRKQKGVRHDKRGFWYKIDYIGDGDFVTEDDTIVDITMTEKLTDGTITEDMDANGTVLSQPLNKYPPVIRNALSLVKNHGAITVVLPPELAYGDDGYLPKIPPGATVIYTIRIDGVTKN